MLSLITENILEIKNTLNSPNRVNEIKDIFFNNFGEENVSIGFPCNSDKYSNDEEYLRGVGPSLESHYTKIKNAADIISSNYQNINSIPEFLKILKDFKLWEYIFGIISYSNSSMFNNSVINHFYKIISRFKRFDECTNYEKKILKLEYKIYTLIINNFINLATEEYSKIEEFDEDSSLWTKLDPSFIVKLKKKGIYTSTFEYLNNIYADIESILRLCKDVFEILKREVVSRELALREISILTYFPKKIITNENGQSLELFDIYVKAVFTFKGIFKSLSLCRSTLTENEYLIGYQHSHCNGSNFEFGKLCLGTGPLSFTTSKLKQSCNRINDRVFSSLMNLFCYELDLYLEVESISGGPYFKINNVITISTTNINKFSLKETPDLNIVFLGPLDIDTFYKKIIHKLINSNIDNIKKNLNLFRINYRNNYLEITNSIFDFIKIVDTILDCNIDLTVTEKEDLVYLSNQSCFILDNFTLQILEGSTLIQQRSRNILEFEPFTIFNFKNNPVTTTIIKNQENSSSIIPHNFHILIYAILYKYIFVYLNTGNYKLETKH